MRPIFCGNFDYDARQSDLERLFRRYGKVDRVDMKTGMLFLFRCFFPLSDHCPSVRLISSIICRLACFFVFQLFALLLSAGSILVGHYEIYVRSFKILHI